MPVRLADRAEHQMSSRSEMHVRVTRRQLFERYQLTLAQGVQVIMVQIVRISRRTDQHERCDLVWTEHCRLHWLEVYVLPARIACSRPHFKNRS